MAGLDPAIHGVPWPPASVVNFLGHVTRHRVDARVKPGHDGTGRVRMTRAMTGTITIVQEGRFQMTDDAGVSHLFILAASAAAESQQLAALQRRQARICVRYKPAPDIIGNTAVSITELDRP
jgi:hypothetical protein